MMIYGLPDEMRLRPRLPDGPPGYDRFVEARGRFLAAVSNDEKVPRADAAPPATRCTIRARFAGKMVEDPGGCEVTNGSPTALVFPHLPAKLSLRA
jgi:hypothetical protein